MSPPRRLPALRLARIGGWTAMVTAGVAVVMTRFSGPGGVPAVPAAEPLPTTTSTVTTTTVAPLPTLPTGGLLVLHLSPTPGVPAEVTTTTAPVAAPAPQPVSPPQPVPAPPPVPSSGS
jgi:hypothetical protein